MVPEKKRTFRVVPVLLILVIGLTLLIYFKGPIARAISIFSYRGNIIKVAQEYCSPLDASRFKSVISNTDHFSSLYISYSNPLGFLSVYAKSPTYGFNFSISDIQYYEGELLTSRVNRQSNAYSHKFTISEMQAIFDHLSQNSEYFFNNEEYEGKYPPPVLLTMLSEPLCSGSYVFSLQVGEPNKEEEMWAIHKCIDEYPVPDHPLYGLFEMLENDFSTKFLE